MLNLIWQFDCRLKPIFATAPAASKNTTHLKCGKKWSRNNHHLATFTKIQSKSQMHIVWEPLQCLRKPTKSETVVEVEKHFLGFLFVCLFV